jgi:hypothetical protein
MKIRRLHDIDLARIAPMPRDCQRKSLEQIRLGYPRFSYDPLRSCFYDIFNVQYEMLGLVAPTDWGIVKAKLNRKCKSEAELTANLRVAKGLYEFAGGGISGREQQFLPMAMGAGIKVAYWLSLILVKERQSLVPFIDPRASRGLTQIGRQFVFSMMHERIRVPDPDYTSVRFAILQFGEPDGDVRHPVLHTDNGVELFTLDEMERMVAGTYELWHEVCEERQATTRRKAGEMRGPLI